jgi:hypothetical protein
MRVVWWLRERDGNGRCKALRLGRAYRGAKVQLRVE